MSMAVRRWFLVASRAAARVSRSRRASSRPCSSTPPSMLPAMAAVVGGGRGGFGRCPPLAGPAPRAAVLAACSFSVLWPASRLRGVLPVALSLSAATAARGLCGRAAPVHPRSSTASSMLPAVVAVVEVGCGGMCRCPLCGVPAPRVSARAICRWYSLLPIVPILAPLAPACRLPCLALRAFAAIVCAPLLVIPAHAALEVVAAALPVLLFFDRSSVGPSAPSRAAFGTLPVCAGSASSGRATGASSMGPRAAAFLTPHAGLSLPGGVGPAATISPEASCLLLPVAYVGAVGLPGIWFHAPRPAAALTWRLLVCPSSRGSAIWSS